MKNLFSLIIFFMLYINLNAMQSGMLHNIVIPCVKAVGKEAFESSKIMAGSIGAAVVYGIVNDQITARICPEYFTEGFHKDMVQRWEGVPILGRLKRIVENTKSPTVIGLVWGPVATWWMGALLGVPVILASRIGWGQKVQMENLVKPTLWALGAMGAYVTYRGITGYLSGKRINDAIDNGTLAEDTVKNAYGAWGCPKEKLKYFIANAHAHEAAYAAGTLIALGMTTFIIGKRLLHR